LRENGVWFANHHSVYPTSTEVNGTVLATGVFPRRSGITANKEYRPEIEPLKQIVVRTMGVGDVLRGRLSAISDRIVVAFVFGSFARGEQGEGSDVDVLVVSKDRKLGLVEATDLLSGAQERLGREVNPFVLNAAEFRRKMREGNHFIRRVVAGEKVFLIGGGDELERLAEERVVEAAQQQRGRNRRLARAGRS